MTDVNEAATNDDPLPDPAPVLVLMNVPPAPAPLTVADHDVAVPVGGQPAEQSPVHDVAPPVEPPVPPEPPAAPTVVDAPYVAQEGSTMTCTMGNWTGEPTGYAYLWRSDGVSCGIGPDYPLAVSDVGHTFDCVLTATNDGGSTSVTSNAVVAV